MEELEPLLLPLSRPPPAVRVRAALRLEDRQYDWGYSKPVVVFDLVWNTAFGLVAAAILLSTSRERPSTPIRPWVLGAVKKLESIYAMISFLWWILGFYWIVVGGQTLLQDAPYLYWSAVVFLAFDVFFAIFCIMLACIIGMALCCCLPCIISFLYTVAGHKGASDADLNMLPKFRFRPATRSESTDELALAPEDLECCICLSQYKAGAELLSLPCSHHFHSGCIIKWLRINATCPLCKYNILNNSGDGLV